MQSQSQFATGRAGGLAQSYSRIMREYREITSEKNVYWTASPVDFEEPSEWHFTVKGPTDSDFEGGVYHGRVILPQNYPFSPPHVVLLTPNGRFEVGKKICLSASNYHPELWQPAWGIRSLLDALHAFFPTPGEGALHSLDWPADVRRRLAKESVNFTCNVCARSNAEIAKTDCLDVAAKRKEAPPSNLPASEAVTTTSESDDCLKDEVAVDDPSPTMSAATTTASAGRSLDYSRENLTVGVADGESPKRVDLASGSGAAHVDENSSSTAVAAPSELVEGDERPADNSGGGHFWTVVSNYFTAREGKDAMMWAADFLILIIVISSIASFVDLILKPPILIKQ
eukprot:Lankesteria_metandrocarpae@DN2043_c0_g1_i1.p1